MPPEQQESAADPTAGVIHTRKQYPRAVRLTFQDRLRAEGLEEGEVKAVNAFIVDAIVQRSIRDGVAEARKLEASLQPTPLLCLVTGSE